MINAEILQGNWNQFKGRIRSKWGQLSDDDVARFGGDVDQLVGLIQRKTGEARDSIERFFNELTSQGSSNAAMAVEAVRETAHQVGERIQDGAQQATEAAQEACEEAEEMIRSRPAESAVVSFGAGLFAGLLVALLLHRK